MKKKFLGLALVASFLLGGCALTTAKIDIKYVPQTGVTSLEEAKPVTVNVQVADNRLDKTKVGCKKNGYGIEMARIVASENVEVTFQKAIECELKARGFSLGADSSVVSIDADLTKYVNDFKMGFFAGDSVAELNMGVTVKNKKGDLLYTRQYLAQGVEQNIQIAGGDNAQAALEKALAEGMQKLFADKAFLAALIKAKN